MSGVTDYLEGTKGKVQEGIDRVMPLPIGGSVRVVVAPTVKFHRLPHGEGLPLPAYETAGAVGIDLRAAEGGELTGYVVHIPTGFAVEIPPGYEGQIRPRSGWSIAGLVVANAPGTIDSDYRGEIKVLVRKSSISTEPITIKRGDRIAQLVIAPVARANVVEVEELSETERGAGGLGSTGAA